MLEQTHNFLFFGYSLFKEPNLLDLSKFNITNVEITDELTNNFTDYEQLELNKFIEYISEKYVNPLYKNYIVTYYAVWDGVDLGSTCWHNDSNEGFDFNVLYYFDDTDEKKGGQIEFKCSERETLIYPKKFDLIFINQNKKFYHKVTRSKDKRRVASIEYKIN